MKDAVARGSEAFMLQPGTPVLISPKQLPSNQVPKTQLARKLSFLQASVIMMRRRGEIVEPCDPPFQSGTPLLLVKPPMPLATAAVFRALDLASWNPNYHCLGCWIRV